MAKDRDIYAPVTYKNTQYDDSRIVEDNRDPIDDAAEAAVAAVKGHLEKQDEEGQER